MDTIKLSLPISTVNKSFQEHIKESVKDPVVLNWVAITLMATSNIIEFSDIELQAALNFLHNNYTSKDSEILNKFVRENLGKGE